MSSLDKQLDEVLRKFQLAVIASTYWEDTAINPHDVAEAKQAILTLVEEQEHMARLDELTKFDLNMKAIRAGDPFEIGAYVKMMVRERIEVLQKGKL